MLECRDRSLYVGITNNLERRVNEHVLGLIPKCYTHDRRPVRLVYAAEFHDVCYAIDWEKKIKGWSRAKKRALITDDWVAIHQLARCRTPRHP
jgi:putative endonuclease